MVTAKQAGIDEIKAVRSHRIKVARHVLRLHALQQAIDVYNAEGLRKAAAFGTHKADRVKYAQLQLHYHLEKQALLGALARGAGLLGKGIRAGAGILGQMGRGVGQAARAGAQQFGTDVMPHLRQAGQEGMQLGRIAGKYVQRAAQPMLGRMQGAAQPMLGRMQGFGQQVSQLRRNPAAIGVASGAAGLLGGYAAGNAAGQRQAAPSGNIADMGRAAAGTGLLADGPRWKADDGTLWELPPGPGGGQMR